MPAISILDTVANYRSCACGLYGEVNDEESQKVEASLQFVCSGNTGRGRSVGLPEFCSVAWA